MKKVHVFIYGERKWLWPTIVLSILTSFSGIFTAFITGEYIDSAIEKSVDRLVHTLILSAGGFCLFFILGFCFIQCKNKLLYSCNVEVKRRLFESFMNTADELPVKEKVSLFTNDLKQVETKGFLSEVLIIQNVLMFLVALAYGLYLNPFTMLAFIVAALFPMISSQIFAKKIKTTSDTWSTNTSRYTGKLSDYMNGKDTILNYNAQASAQSDFFNVITQLENSLKKMNNTVDFSSKCVETVAGLAIFGGAFGFGVIQIIQQHLSLGEFIAIVQVSNYLINPLMTIAKAMNDRKTTTLIFERIQRILDKPAGGHVESIPRIHSMQLKNGGLVLGEKELFSGIDLSLQQGEKLLIKGASGSGKSTFLKALGGFVEFNEGEYLLNHTQYSTRFLQQSVAFMKQDPFIFDETILFNITMGKDYDQQKLDEVIQQSQLTELIAEKGFLYKVGEKGENLSGGQLQRIEIARGLLAERPIILADEVTSALDGETSRKIHQALFNLDQVVIEVSHKVPAESDSTYTQVLDFNTINEQP